MRRPILPWPGGFQHSGIHVPSSPDLAFVEICRASRLRPGNKDAVSGLCIRMARIMMLETESGEAK